MNKMNEKPPTRELRDKGVEDKEGVKHGWDTLRLFTWPMSEEYERIDSSIRQGPR